MTVERVAQDVNSIALAADIVAAYVANNPLPIAELPRLIVSVHTAVADLALGVSPRADLAETVKRPSVAEIRKSIRPDGIVSFIDGKIYTTLKRHLTANGLHPVSYRERYGLPSDYPMVAAAYAERRSQIAKAIGLGRPGATADRTPKSQKAA